MLRQHSMMADSHNSGQYYQFFYDFQKGKSLDYTFSEFEIKCINTFKGTT